MTEPSPARPVPGPPRPGPAPAGTRPTGSTRPDDRSAGPAADGFSPTADGSSAAVEPSPTEEATRSESASFEDLGQRPVAEHVGVFEAEHARLQRELGTIDQL